MFEEEDNFELPDPEKLWGRNRFNSSQDKGKQKAVADLPGDFEMLDLTTEVPFVGNNRDESMQTSFVDDFFFDPGIADDNGFFNDDSSFSQDVSSN